MKTNEEIAQYKKEWALKNKDKIKERMHLYYQEHKDIVVERSAKRFNEKKEEILKKSKTHYQLNKKRILESQKIYVEKNKDKTKKYLKEYILKNKDRLKKHQAEYFQDNKEILYERNKLSIKKYRLKYKEKYRLYNQEYKENRKKNDPLFKLTVNIRSIISGSIKRKNYTKRSQTQHILGCSFNEFKIYLESKFEPWMNWNNYGNWNGEPTEINCSWDIDHIIPLSTAKSEEDILKLNYYTNLQPLCSYTNRHIKSNKC